MSRDYSRRLPAGTKVSAGTPVGRNVTAHFPLVRDFKSAVRGRPGLGVSNGPYIRPDPTGKAAMGVGSGKISTGLLASDLGMDGAKARTIIVEFMQMDVSGGRAVYSFGAVSTQHRSQFSLLSASNFRRVKLETYANDYEYILWDQGGTYARVFLAITYDGGTTIRVRSHCRVFLNNGAPQGVVSRSFTTTTGGILATGDTVPLDLMGGGVYSFASMNSQLFNATFIGGRALTEREIDNFYRNPQQIMAAAPSFPYPLLDSVATAPSSHTLPAAQGSYAITGNAARLAVARKLTASAGAYTLTGKAVALRSARRLAAASGAYTIIGNAAQLIKGAAPRALEAAAGRYVITGRPAALRAGRRLRAEAGSYVLTGFAAAAAARPALNLVARFHVLPRNFNLKTIHFSD